MEIPDIVRDQLACLPINTGVYWKRGSQIPPTFVVIVADSSIFNIIKVTYSSLEIQTFPEGTLLQFPLQLNSTVKNKKTKSKGSLLFVPSQLALHGQLERLQLTDYFRLHAFTPIGKDLGEKTFHWPEIYQIALRKVRSKNEVFKPGHWRNIYSAWCKKQSLVPLAPEFASHTLQIKPFESLSRPVSSVKSTIIKQPLTAESSKRLSELDHSRKERSQADQQEPKRSDLDKSLTTGR